MLICINFFTYFFFLLYYLDITPSRYKLVSNRSFVKTNAVPITLHITEPGIDTNKQNYFCDKCKLKL